MVCMLLFNCVNYNEVSYLKGVSVIYWNIREFKREDGLKRKTETWCYYLLNIVKYFIKQKVVSDCQVTYILNFAW
jgi:hypothetical protein